MSDKEEIIIIYDRKYNHQFPILNLLPNQWTLAQILHCNLIFSSYI